MVDFYEGASAGITQVLWQGLNWQYLGVSDDNLMFSNDAGLTWGQLSQNATLGSDNWPVGAVAHQMSYAIGPRPCDDLQWIEIRDLDDGVPVSDLSFWAGLCVMNSVAPDGVDVQFNLIDSRDLDNDAFPHIYSYFVTITGPSPDPEAPVTWFKANIDLTDRIIRGKAFYQSKFFSIGVIPAGGPDGAHYNGPYSLLNKMAINAFSSAFAIVGRFAGRNTAPYGRADLGALLNEQNITFNGLEVTGGSINDVVGPISGDPDNFHAIGPLINPTTLEDIFDRYWDEGDIFDPVNHPGSAPQYQQNSIYLVTIEL